jgi:hypothetical protein
MTLIKWRFNMKLNTIYKYALAIVLFAFAVFVHGCHGVQW